MDEVVTDEAAQRSAGSKQDRGASLVEYALLLGLIAIVCIVAITTLGGNLCGSFDSSGSSLFEP